MLSKLYQHAFGFFFTVNVAHSPSQSLEGQAEMSEPPQLADWTDSTVIDGNANQTAFGFSCAITDFSKNYTSVWLKIHYNDYLTSHILKYISEMKEVS